MKPKLVEFLNAGKVFFRTHGFILEYKLKGRPLTLDRRRAADARVRAPAARRPRRSSRHGPHYIPTSHNHCINHCYQHVTAHRNSPCAGPRSLQSSAGIDEALMYSLGAGGARRDDQEEDEHVDTNKPPLGLSSHAGCARARARRAAPPDLSRRRAPQRRRARPPLKFELD